jgi:Bromodomain
MIRGFSEKFSKPFPFKSHKVVFLPGIGDCLRFAGLSIIDEKFLLSDKIHEGLNKTIRELVSSACYNWLECLHKIVSWADYWLVYGLQEYFARSYIGEVIDLNELKFIIDKEVKVYCTYVEKGLDLRPLCNMFFINPNDLLTDPVFRLKSGLIFHMIESKVGKLHLRNVLQGFLSPQSTTSEFIKAFKKIYRISLKEFAKNWIYGTGAPLLQCKFSYNKRDNTLDFSLDQSPLFQSYLDSSANKQFPSLGNTNYQVPLRLNMMRFYTGPISIIIYETDGMEIESFKKDIEVNREHFKTSIQCKKKLKKPNNPKRREETEEEKFSKQNECPVLWVRVDPDFEILRKVEIAYTDFMWMEQLKKEKEDVLAQYEAILAARTSTDYTNVLNLLYEKLEDKQCFYRVRMKAAKSLSAISYPINAYKGLDYLIYYFKTKHFEKKLLKANDFSSRDEYFVDKTVLKSIIKVSDMSLTYNYARVRVNSSFVVEFLADVLKNNDNSCNTYDDCYWRGNLLEILGNTTNPIYIEQIYNELIWNSKIDMTIPSHNYIITKSCLLGLLKICAHHKLSLQSEYNNFYNKIMLYPPRIQQKIIMFMINYLYFQHAHPLEILKIPLKVIKSNPEHGNFYIKCIWKFTKRLGNKDWVLYEARSSDLLRNTLWDLCTSPYSQANPYFAHAITSLYKYFFPRDWSLDVLDPAWEEKQDSDPYQHRFEAIDLTKGTWEEWGEEVLSRIMKHEYSGPFLEPVDIEAEELYDYNEIITHPMDFSTVQAKLSDAQYSNFHDLVSDVRLIFDNCRLYNAEGCTLYKHAEMLDTLFRDLVAPIEEHLGISQPEVKLKLRMFAGDVQIDHDNN